MQLSPWLIVSFFFLSFYITTKFSDSNGKFLFLEGVTSIFWKCLRVPVTLPHSVCSDGLHLQPTTYLRSSLDPTAVISPYTKRGRWDPQLTLLDKTPVRRSRYRDIKLIGKHYIHPENRNPAQNHTVFSGSRAWCSITGTGSGKYYGALFQLSRVVTRGTKNLTPWRFKSRTGRRPACR